MRWDHRSLKIFAIGCVRATADRAMNRPEHRAGRQIPLALIRENSSSGIMRIFDPIGRVLAKTSSKENACITPGVDSRLVSDRNKWASDVVRAGLRLLEEKEAKLEALRIALVEGERSGEAEPFDFDEFLARKKSTRI